MSCLKDNSPPVAYCAVVGFPDYKVGSDGSVWSGVRRDKAGEVAWRKLKMLPNHRGYSTVALHNSAGLKRRKVHHLVLEAFVGPREPGQVSRHYPDRDVTNNNLRNLRWGTQQENCDDRMQMGTVMWGERHHKAKLTKQDVREIRRDWAAGKFRTVSAAAQRYGVTISAIRAIIIRRTWQYC